MARHEAFLATQRFFHGSEQAIFGIWHSKTTPNQLVFFGLTLMSALGAAVFFGLALLATAGLAAAFGFALAAGLAASLATVFAAGFFAAGLSADFAAGAGVVIFAVGTGAGVTIAVASPCFQSQKLVQLP